MTLTLSEEQAFLKDTAKKFAQEKTPTTHFREIRDNENPECFDRAIWQEMAAQGWSGILVVPNFPKMSSRSFFLSKFFCCIF